MNEKLEYWSYHLMQIDKIFLKLHGMKFYSNLDVRSNYYKITVARDSRKYTVFTTEYGKNEFVRESFGIHVAPSYFALMIHETLQGLDFCFAYLDDFIIDSKTEETTSWPHLTGIQPIIDSQYQNELTKCNFFKCQIHYLRHLLSQDGVSLLLANCRQWKKTMPPPKYKRFKTNPWLNRLLQKSF